MKRCPQCEFIYEDDQSLCDMDGALLVFDSRTLPNMHALAPVAGVELPVASKAPWRHRTFPAMAALILATVLSLVYFVSTQRGTAPSAPVNVPSVTLPASKLAAPPQANPTPEPPAAQEEPAAAPVSKEEPKPDTTKASSPAKKANSKTSTTTTQPKPAEEPKKDDSKVGSILKKTGRILKKPFKF
jgi:outer membrane biosynthesis protein TonB